MPSAVPEDPAVFLLTSEARLGLINTMPMANKDIRPSAQLKIAFVLFTVYQKK